MKAQKCKRCGDCCRWGGYVYITEDDITAISSHLGMTKYDFVNTYAEIVNRPRINLKTKDDGSCIFQSGNDCSIHRHKPKQCREFPDVWRIKDLESFCSAQREEEDAAR